ncbi:hypothetical protein [Nocardia implantans]|uniref:Uncharacterized protein n=1 Tax=Nocardia implantans TaxID=3108168 RepID=A0ABU6AZE4_9NOCA|nr:MULTISPECIES: hypothetical protein [unclassified Nocardia]MBF6194032.1 hypothetical protein [Nocardia beijingensis]MEA3529639.1 hypothetical protein [Nocardia sp. CDC192]MEB3512883.1 hypothetical protein [Nocardia sp. CDC186]
MRSVLPMTIEAGGARFRGSATGGSGGRSKKGAFALFIAGLAAGTVAAAGGAAAESLSRGDHSGRSGSHGDSTGWHKIDPFGYQHSDPNPLRQNEHQHALREYHRQSKPRPDESGAGNEAGESAWTRTERPDGSGWTVCRPQAKWC